MSPVYDQKAKKMSAVHVQQNTILLYMYSDNKGLFYAIK